MKLHTLIFDIDGTLWDTTEVVAGAWNRAIHQSGIQAEDVTGTILKGEFGKTMEVIAADLFPEITAEQQAELLRLCCEYEEEALHACERDLAYPQMRETLRELAKTRKLFIVSNCQCGYIELFLEKNGLADCIEDFECYGNTGRGKGDNLRLLVERNHLEDAVYLGDTQGDYDACQEAGVPMLHARYGFGSVRQSVDGIDSLPELLLAPFA